MRKVIFEGYVNNVFVKAFDGYEKAESWQKENPQGVVRTKLVPMYEEEGEKERKDRITRIARRNIVRNIKRKGGLI